MSMNKLRAVLHDLLFEHQYRNHDILFFEDDQIRDLWYVMVAHPNAVQMLVTYQNPSARISGNFLSQTPHPDIDFLFTIVNGNVTFIPMGWNKPTLPGIAPAKGYGTADIALAISQFRQANQKAGFQGTARAVIANPDMETSQTSWCKHEWVDVGFNHSKVVCKKCDKEQNENEKNQSDQANPVRR